MNHLQRLQWAEYEWSIEEYHRGLKQCCGVDKCLVRSARAQRNHVGLSIRAFLRLELHWFNSGISWYESKLSLVRDAVRSYLAATSVYSFSNCVTPDSNLKTMLVFTIKEGKAYICNYTGDRADFDLHLPTIDNILASITIN